MHDFPACIVHDLNLERPLVAAAVSCAAVGVYSQQNERKQGKLTQNDTASSATLQHAIGTTENHSKPLGWMVATGGQRRSTQAAL